MKIKKINIYYIFIICFSSILMFGCKFFNKPMDVYLEKYTKEIFVEDYKFDNEWISTRDGSIVIQPGNTNLEVIIFNSMGVELNPKLEVVSGHWNEDSKFSANSSANNLVISCKLENIEEGDSGVLQLSWPTKDGLRTFAPYNFPNIICNKKPPTPENLQVEESKLSWSLDATVGNSIEDDLVQIDILLSQEGATSYTTNSFYRDESGWGGNLTVSDTNYTYTLAETEKRANTEFAVVVYDKHGQKSLNSTEGFLAKAAPKTEKDETTGATIHLIESSENMLWLAWELKVGAMTSFNIKLTEDIVIDSGKWQFSELNMPDHSTIDGQGYSITINEDVSKFGNSAGGLFYKFNNSTVKNLVLKGSITANTSAGGYIGALCRSAYGSIFENVMSEVTITDNGSGFVGGLIGRLGTNVSYDASKAMVKNCAVYADVSSTNGIAGGILGGIWEVTRCCTIQDSIYMGEINGPTLGAIVGINENNNVAKSVLKNIWYCVTNNSSIPLIGTKAATTTEDITDVERKTTADIATAGAAALLGDAWEYVSGDYPTLKSVN